MEKVTNNSDTNYCKMPDGIAFCWGEAHVESGSTITLPISMIGARVFFTPVDANEASVKGIYTVNSYSVTGSSFKVKAFQAGTITPLTSTLHFMWFVIGRWK